MTYTINSATANGTTLSLNVTYDFGDGFPLTKDLDIPTPDSDAEVQARLKLDCLMEYSNTRYFENAVTDIATNIALSIPITI